MSQMAKRRKRTGKHKWRFSKKWWQRGRRTCGKLTCVFFLSQRYPQTLMSQRPNLAAPGRVIVKIQQKIPESKRTKGPKKKRVPNAMKHIGGPGWLPRDACWIFPVHFSKDKKCGAWHGKSYMTVARPEHPENRPTRGGRKPWSMEWIAI